MIIACELEQRDSIQFDDLLLYYLWIDLMVECMIENEAFGLRLNAGFGIYDAYLPLILIVALNTRLRFILLLIRIISADLYLFTVILCIIIHIF